jgi:hypothetical protein
MKADTRVAIYQTKVSWTPSYQVGGGERSTHRQQEALGDLVRVRIETSALSEGG